MSEGIRLAGNRRIGESYVPEADDYLSRMTRSDDRYLAALSVGRRKGKLNDRQKQDFAIAVNEGLIEPDYDDTEFRDQYKKAVKLRERNRVQNNGLTPLESETLRDRDRGGTWEDRAKTFGARFGNDATFGAGDRVAATSAKISGGAEGSRASLIREYGDIARERGAKDPYLNAARATRMEAEDRNPVTAVTGSVAGFLAPGAAGAKATSAAARGGARMIGLSRASRAVTPVGTTRVGRIGRYAKDVLPRAAAGGAVDGAIYGQTVSRSDKEAREQRSISMFSGEANELMLRDAAIGAAAGAVLSPVYRGGRAVVTDVSDRVRGIDRSARAGGRKGLDALEYRMTPADRRKEVLFQDMQRSGIDAKDAEYVVKALNEGRVADAEKVLRPAYTKALIMIEKRLRKENIPIERLENKIREISYAGENVSEFFFEIAALAGSGKTQSLANALATVGGEAKNIAVKNFDDRSFDAFEEVKKSLNAAFKIDGSDYYNDWDALKERGQQKVAAAYRQAEETGALTDETWTDISDVENGVFSRPAVRAALDNAETLAADAGRMAESREIKSLKRSFKDYDDARRTVEEEQLKGADGDQGVIDKAKTDMLKAQERIRAQKPTVAAFKFIDEELTDMRFKANSPTSDRNPRGIAQAQNELRSKTDTETGLKGPRDLNAKYETANTAYEEGRKMFAQGTDIETLLSRFERQIAKYDGTDPEILPALLAAFVRGAEDALATAGGIGTALRRLYGSPRARQKLIEMLNATKAQAKAQGKGTGGMTKSQTALLGGKRRVTKVAEDGSGGTYQETVSAPGRLVREIAMQDSKSQTVRGSGTAMRQQAVREQDEFEEFVDQAVQTAQGGWPALIGKYGRAAVRFGTQSGIYDPAVNRELGNIVFTGGRKHLDTTIENLKKVRAARMGKGDLDNLAPPARAKLMNPAATSVPIVTGQGNKKPGGGKKQLPNEQPVRVRQDPTFRKRPGRTRVSGFVSPTVLGEMAFGSVAGSASGMTIDYNNDGVNDLDDARIGAAIGMMGLPVLGRIGRARIMNGAVKPNMFVGENARGVDLNARDRAIEMERAGQDPRSIWRETRWHRGDDGKWRTEILDYDAETAATLREKEAVAWEEMGDYNDFFKEEFGDIVQRIERGEVTPVEAKRQIDEFADRHGYKIIKGSLEKIQARKSKLTAGPGSDGFASGMLDEVLDHPQLFDAYPQLRDTPIVFQRMKPQNGGATHHLPNGSSVVYINSLSPPERARTVLLHEIMHLVQKIEGFAPGGNVADPRFNMPGQAQYVDEMKRWRQMARDRLVQDGVEETPDTLRHAAMTIHAERMAQGLQNPPMFIVRDASEATYDGIPTDEYIQKTEKLYNTKRLPVDPPEADPKGYGEVTVVDNAFRIYTRTMGEQEARNVDVRSRLSEDQARRFSPEDTIFDDPYRTKKSERIDSREYEGSAYYSADPDTGAGTSELSQTGPVQDGGGVDGRGEGVRPSPSALLPLDGAPKEVTVPGVGKVKVEPFAPAREARDRYMKKTGRSYTPIKTYKKVDPERAKRIATAFEEMPHAPTDPAVRASYDAMIRETVEQFREIEQSGLKVEFIEDGMPDPYEASPRLAIEDVKNNNHLWVFPTDSGYGQSGITPDEIAQNPLLAETDIIIGGRKARANDIFRIVHDYFGHIAEGNGFRADGEENAWRLHASMYSPEAVPAMTSETRGQNSWLNFGPHGEANQTAKSADTVYAEQKIGLLPDWVYTEGLADDYYPKQEGAGFLGQQTAVEFARGRPNEEQLLKIRKRQIQYDQRLGKKDAPNSTMPAKQRMELEEINARLKELRAQDPSVKANGLPISSFKDIDNAITTTGQKVTEKVRGRMAPVEDPRHYGPRLAEYGLPKDIDFDRPVYDQIANPRMAAADIADAATTEGGEASGRAATEYVGRVRRARDEAADQTAARNDVIAARAGATRELNKAKAHLEAFFGANGEHVQFKTQKAKRAEAARRLQAVSEAEAKVAATKGAAPPARPSSKLSTDQREDMIPQEMNRAERPIGYKTVREMVAERTGGNKVVSDDPDQAWPVIRHPKARKPGRRRAAIDNRATELLMKPEMASEVTRAVNDGRQGFAVSRRVGRAAGYAMAATAAGGVYGAVKAGEAVLNYREEEKRRWKESLDTYGDIPENLGERMQVDDQWKKLDWGNRVRIQNTLNAHIDRQVNVDGAYGPDTEASLREFQRQVGIEETGVLDNETLKRLNLLYQKDLFAYELEKRREDREGSR